MRPVRRGRAGRPLPLSSGWPFGLLPEARRADALSFGFTGESADLGGVVSEDTPSAPAGRADLAVAEGAPPPVVTLEAGDASLAAGAPLDEPPERTGVLHVLAG